MPDLEVLIRKEQIFVKKTEIGEGFLGEGRLKYQREVLKYWECRWKCHKGRQNRLLLNLREKEVMHSKKK
jgi:hypothetical protein